MNNYWDYAAQSSSQYFQLQPAPVKGAINAQAQVERRYLAHKLYSVFDFDLPDNWDHDYFKLFTLLYGSTAIIYTKQFGWINGPYSIIKMGLYYKPVMIEVMNQWMDRPATGLSGINCGVVRCFGDYCGFFDLLNQYATTLALLERDVNINLMTCNTGYMILASGKKEADTIQELYSRSSQGQPLVIAGQGNFKNGNRMELVNPDVSKNFLVDKLLGSRRDIVNNFLTEIGIPNANYQKKERQTIEEVRQNNRETTSIVTVARDNIQREFDKINAISGLNLRVKLNLGGDDSEIDAIRDDAMGQDSAR